MNTLRLRIFMLERGFSQRKLARILGVSNGQIDNILKSRTAVPHLRKRLRDELGFPPEFADYRPDASKLNRARTGRRAPLNSQGNSRKVAHARS